MNNSKLLAVKKALIENDYSVSAAAESLDWSRGKMRCYLQQIGLDTLTDADDPEIKEFAKFQKATDKLRIERKKNREIARPINAIKELTQELVFNLKKLDKKKPRKRKRPKVTIRNGVGVIHWSDHHLNELVSASHNTFDWYVAAKRLRKHVLECILYIKAKGCTSVVVAMTGDLINSDRRLDELLSNAGNRSKALILAVLLYRQALTELQDHFNVTCISVSGNESRMTKDVGWSPEVASDNYDFTIYECLKIAMENSGVEFPEHDNPSEWVLNVAGQNLLFMHGHTSIARGDQKSIQEKVGMYMGKGIEINAIFWGHIHNALIADGYARSSSLVGTNDYAEKALGLAGRASQNLYIVHQTGGFDGIKIDLQNTDGIEGYDIEDKLIAYNTKSANKVRKPDVIHQVVV